MTVLLNDCALELYWLKTRATRAPSGANLARMTVDGPISPELHGFSARRQVERSIAEIAQRQYGVVSLMQLVALGISEGAVQQRADACRWHRVHSSVYLVGHVRLTREGQYLAAVLACGQGAVLSHRSAADLWGIRQDRRSSIDVTAPGRRGRTPSGIDAHRDGSLTHADRSILRGIPCTTLVRTLLDLSGAIPIGEVRRAISEAEVQRALSMDALHELLRRSRGRRGVARLRMLVETMDPLSRRTRSELERMFLTLCRRAGLPPPEVNPLIDLGDVRFRPDFLWRDARLIMETDGHRFHATYSAFDADRRREQRLLLAGWRVSHCAWAQVEQEPLELARILRGLLSKS